MTDPDDEALAAARGDMEATRAAAEADPADAVLQRALAGTLERLAHRHILRGEHAAAWPLLEDAVAHRRTLLHDGPPETAPFELASACIQAVFAAPDGPSAQTMYALAADTLNPLVAAGVDHPRLTKLVEGLARIGQEMADKKGV